MRQSRHHRHPRGPRHSLLVLLAALLATALSTGGMMLVGAQEEEGNSAAAGGASPDPDATTSSGGEEPQQQQQQQQGEGSDGGGGTATETETKPDEKPSRKRASSGGEDGFDASSTDWGTYYDPQNVFCGKYDCYKILGLDYEESYGKDIDRKVITQRYRALSREWHPDKSKHRDAKERFVKIARAYEVLGNRINRKEYDDLRYDPEKYYMKYGTSVLWSYAPKSDTAIVILVLLVVGNVFSWMSQKHRWQLVADRLVKAAVEDWSPSQGGTPESKVLREEAMATLADRERQKNASAAAANGTGSGTAESPSAATAATSSAKKSGKGGKKGDGGKKLSGKEKRRQEQEALLPVVREMVYAMDDFGAGFHKPTWRDLLIVTLAKLPFKVGREVVWFSGYYARRLRGVPLSDSEKLVLTQRAVGPITWTTASDEEKDKMVARELWVVANLAEWSEEQEFNKLSAGERKEIMRMKKKGINQMDPNLLKED